VKSLFQEENIVIIEDNLKKSLDQLQEQIWDIRSIPNRSRRAQKENVTQPSNMSEWMDSS